MDSLLSYRLLRWLRSFRRKVWPGGRPTVELWYRFFLPPYGGGSQFLIALTREPRKSGIDVIDLPLSGSMDICLVNGFIFKNDSFRDFLESNGAPRVVHHINGPSQHYRDRGKATAEKMMALKREFASATVVQSEYTLRGFREIGFEPVNPVIIPNAVDPSIFHACRRIEFDPNRKVRLISTSWSHNLR